MAPCSVGSMDLAPNHTHPPPGAAPVTEPSTSPVPARARSHPSSVTNRVAEAPPRATRSVSTRARSAVALVLAVVALATATRADAALRQWSGLGDGTSWSQGTNWVGGVAPGAADDVLLDNAQVTGNYTV